jgi:hypothetical protein
MSIAQQVAERVESDAKRAARGDFMKLCHLLLKHGSPYNARNAAEAERASSRVQNILAKAAVSPGGLDTWSSIADYINVQQAFQESLRSLSVFDAVLADGMVRAPLRSRGFSITTGIVGGTIPERSIKVISSLSLSQQLLEPRKSVAVINCSKELMNFPGATQLFAAELTKGVVAATDSNFITALIAATTPTASAGATLAAAITDFDVLLTAVTTSATSRLFYVSSPAKLNHLLPRRVQVVRLPSPIWALTAAKSFLA